MISYSKQTITFLDALYVAWQVKFKSLTQGKAIEKFEASVAQYVGAKFAVAVSSATAGLHLCHLALGYPAGSKIVTSPISFVASANSILYAGLVPVFVDIEPATGNISTAKLIELINEDQIKSVVPVHYAGMPCDMSTIFKICKEKNISIIEDAAHALGAEYDTGEKVGSCTYSDMTVFSFHPVKSITTGEGGMITTNNREFYEKLKSLRSHGIKKDAQSTKNKTLAMTNGKPNLWFYEMNSLGYHYRLTEIQAALGYSQMKKINRFMRKRKKICKRYERLLSKKQFFSSIQVQEGKKSANHLYVIKINFEKVKLSRNELMLALRKRKIITQVHYIPIPLHPYYEDLGYSTTNIPNAMDFYNKVLSIPIYPKLTYLSQRKVIRNLSKILGG